MTDLVPCLMRGSPHENSTTILFVIGFFSMYDYDMKYARDTSLHFSLYFVLGPWSFCPPDLLA